jgi:hypothetical protein
MDIFMDTFDLAEGSKTDDFKRSQTVKKQGVKGVDYWF